MLGKGPTMHKRGRSRRTFSRKFLDKGRRLIYLNNTEVGGKQVGKEGKEKKA